MSKKAWFVTLLVVWLAAWPVSFILGLIASRLYVPTVPMDIHSLSLNADVTPPMVRVLNIIGALCGIYTFVGWIPALIVHSKMQKVKKAV